MLQYNIGPTSFCSSVQRWCSISQHFDVGSTTISQHWINIGSTSIS